VDPRAWTRAASSFLTALILLSIGLELDDQLHGQASSGLADQVAGLDGGDHRSGLGRGQELRCPAREELQQQSVQSVDGLGVRPAELVASVDQHAHHEQVVVELDPQQARCPQRDHRDRVRIDRIGLAAVPSREHPGRHVDHGLTVMPEPMHDVFADAVTALDRPQPIRVLPAGLEHHGVSSLVGSVSPRGEDLSPLVDDLNGRGTLVWIHSDDDAHTVPPASVGQN
jgi:hypothetical protein